MDLRELHLELPKLIQPVRHPRLQRRVDCRPHVTRRTFRDIKQFVKQ